MPDAQQESGSRVGLLAECPLPQVLQPAERCPAPRKASEDIMPVKPGEDEGSDSDESDSFSSTSAAPDGRFATGHGLYWQYAGLPLTMASFPRGYTGRCSDGSEEQSSDAGEVKGDKGDNDYTAEDQSEQDFEAVQKHDRRAALARSFNAYHNDKPWHGGLYCKCAFCCSLS